MPLKLCWKQIMTGSIAITLAAGSGAAVLSSPVQINAEQLQSTSPFTDVTPGHWAEKHIAKLYLQHIINGYENTASGTVTFKPENSVSQQEAVLMALRFAGLDRQADSDAIIVFDSSFQVADWAKPYVALAFTEGLLEREEEYALAAADQSVQWGEKPASREWVTKLIVRAIGQQAVAGQLQDTESSFEDAADIDSRYRGYVNAAVQLKLVKGITETTFGADKPVTRASLATLLSRAQASFPVDYEGQSAGVVSELTETSLTLYHEGEETTYALDESTLYFHYNSEKPITKDQLLEYGDVSVIAEDGKALYVEAQGDIQHTKTITGTYARYNSSESTIYIWVEDKPVAIPYEPGLVIEDSEGSPLSILDLKPNSNLTIVQDSFRDKPIALSIIAETAAAATQISGSFQSGDKNIVTIRTADGSLVSKDVAPGATVEIKGLDNPGFGDLIKNEDAVELSLNADDQVTKVKVTNREIEVMVGARITQYDAKYKFMTVVDLNGEPISLKLTDKSEFDVSGAAIDLNTAVSLISQNFYTTVRYTDNQIVSVHFSNSISGSVTAIDTKLKTISVLADGVNLTLPYTATTIDMAGRPLANHLDIDLGDVVTLQLNPAKFEASAIRMHVATKYTVSSVDAATMKMKVKTSTNISQEISLTGAEIILADGNKGTLSALKAGASIEVSYVGSTAVKVQIL
ncbi:S-layer homology domain-containing protein [Paenibacillus soyae]|uniref:S-layer homology domain-containing protein n=1 Tax=Paenibacillus soyae TaxID=2969249 RepID=A0A9X2MNK0_9BACL|nr:S-layer homology domain-containing protein [Paenibacillus soyae]MCR2802951.1 S-layer homology domain-containing protein [Paenibacillus soyae]